jgi:hypothetical protein
MVMKFPRGSVKQEWIRLDASFIPRAAGEGDGVKSGVASSFQTGSNGWKFKVLKKTKDIGAKIR